MKNNILLFSILFIFILVFSSGCAEDNSVDDVSGAAPPQPEEIDRFPSDHPGNQVPDRPDTNQAPQTPDFTFDSDSSGVPYMFERGSFLVLSILFGNPSVIVLLLIILFTILFYYIFVLGLSFIPHLNSDKTGHMSKKIAKILALISASGLFGFPAIVDGPGAVVANVISILQTTRLLAVWGIAILMGALVYFTLSKAHSKYPHPSNRDAHEQRGKWLYVLVTIFFTLFIGYGLLGEAGTSMTFLILSGIALIILIIPRDHANPFSIPRGRPWFFGDRGRVDGDDKSNKVVSTQESGDNPQNNDEFEEDDSSDKNDNLIKTLAKEADKQKKDLEKMFRLIKKAAIWNGLVKRYSQDEVKSRNKIINEMENLDLSSIDENNFKTFKEKLLNVLKLIKDVNNTNLKRKLKRNTRKEFRSVEQVISEIKELSSKTGNSLKNIASEIPDSDLSNLIAKNEELISASLNYAEKVNEIILLIQDNSKNMGALMIKEKNSLKQLQNILKSELKYSEFKNQESKLKENLTELFDAVRELNTCFEKMFEHSNIINQFDAVIQKELLDSVKIDDNLIKELENAKNQIDNFSSETKVDERKAEIAKLFEGLEKKYPAKIKKTPFSYRNEPFKKLEGDELKKKEDEIKEILNQLRSRINRNYDIPEYEKYLQYHNFLLACNYRRTMTYVDRLLKDLESGVEGNKNDRSRYSKFKILQKVHGERYPTLKILKEVLPYNLNKLENCANPGNLTNKDYIATIEKSVEEFNNRYQNIISKTNFDNPEFKTAYDNYNN